MTNLILLAIAILCIIYVPEILLFLVLIAIIACFHTKYKIVIRDRAVANEVEDEPTMEEKAEKEVESKMKKGFRDDPKWQAASKKINDHANIMRNISDLELEIEDLEEAGEESSIPFIANTIDEKKKDLKTLENQAGITQKRAERAKEEKIDPPKAQTPHKDMTDQEIDKALQELNDL